MHPYLPEKSSRAAFRLLGLSALYAMACGDASTSTKEDHKIQQKKQEKVAKPKANPKGPKDPVPGTSGHEVPLEKCGNGSVESSEACDPKADPSKLCVDISPKLGQGIALCSKDCQWNINSCKGLTTKCGNGELEAGEACDPAIATEMPCTSVSKKFSSGVVKCTDSCLMNTSSCVKGSAQCGDGKLDYGEQCDDGNKQEDDKCSNECSFIVDGLPALYEGPERKWGLADAIFHTIDTPCVNAETRKDWRKKYVATVKYQIVLCQTTKGADAFKEHDVREHMKAVSQFYRDQASIELVENGLVRFSHPSCILNYDSDEAQTFVDINLPQVVPVVFATLISSTLGTGKIGGYGPHAEKIVTTHINPGDDTTVHEFGHYFGLAHTHDCLRGKETSANCTTTGDGLCDTPPDPGPKGIAYGTCKDGAPLDANCDSSCGQKACEDGAKPDRKNAMSYYPCSPSHLSQEQADFIRCELDLGDLRHVNASTICVPGSEVCDGKDNDCDGLIDDITRPCGEDLNGCQTGTQRCKAGTWLPGCESAVSPMPEVCDGKDNDCNGVVDNDVNPLQDQSGFRCPSLGLCADGGARSSCENGKWKCVLPANFVKDECKIINPSCGAGGLDDITCSDQIDNDCDGGIDEHSIHAKCAAHPDFPSVQSGAPCWDSVAGVCGEKAGTHKCLQLAEGCGIQIDCIGAQNPTEEVCDNGKDEDCDGHVDNRGDRDRDGYGVCDGRKDCRDDPLDVLSSKVHPGAVEQCNGIDDNCNDKVDDGLAIDCSSHCGGGASTCVNGVWGPCTAPTSANCSECMWPGTRDCGSGACRLEKANAPSPSSNEYFIHDCGRAEPNGHWYVDANVDKYCDAVRMRAPLPPGRYRGTVDLWAAGAAVGHAGFVDVWIGGRHVAQDEKFIGDRTWSWEFDMPKGCEKPDLRVVYRGGYWTEQIRVKSVRFERIP